MRQWIRSAFREVVIVPRDRVPRGDYLHNTYAVHQTQQRFSADARFLFRLPALLPAHRV